MKKRERPEGDWNGKNGENEEEKPRKTPDGQYGKRGGCTFYDEVPAFILCAHRRASIAAGCTAVPVQPAGEDSEYRDYCHLHSRDFFCRAAGGETGRKQEICMGAADGGPVFCRTGARFSGGEPERRGCGREFRHRILPVRRERNAGRDAVQLTAIHTGAAATGIFPNIFVAKKYEKVLFLGEKLCYTTISS